MARLPRPSASRISKADAGAWGESWESQGTLMGDSQGDNFGLRRTSLISHACGRPEAGAFILRRHESGSGSRQGAAQNLRGGEALAEQVMRGGAADCGEIGAFLGWHVGCIG